MAGLAPYLQLLSLLALQLDDGSASVSWSGSSPACLSAQCNHGLGRVPTRILVTPRYNLNADAVYWAPLAFSADASKFFVTGRTLDGSSPANTKTSAFDWIAIG